MTSYNKSNLPTKESKRREKRMCDYCSNWTTSKDIDTCDGGTAVCCMDCREGLRHEHDENGECII